MTSVNPTNSPHTEPSAPPQEQALLDRMNFMMHQLLEQFGQSQQAVIQRQVNAAVENVVRQVQSNGATSSSSASDAQPSHSPVSGANEMKANSQGISPFLPPNVRVKISPPSTFTGARSLNVENWLNEMKHYLTLCGVLGEEQQVAVAASYLKETASQWWQSRAQLANPPRNWSTFVSAVKDRFQPLAASRTARAQLRILRQGNLSVSDYSSKFNSLVQLISDMSQADQVELFIYGLRSTISREVDLRDPKTLYEAMTAAQKVESLFDNRRTYSHSSYDSRTSPSPSSYISNPSSSSAASSSSSSSSASAPMELGNVTTAAVENNDYDRELFSEQIEAEPDDEYERYLEEGDNFEPNYELWDEVEQRNKEDEHVEQLQAMQQRNQRRTAPYLSPEEFTRCMNQRLCLRCKKPGHIARNCPLRTQHPPSQQQQRPRRRF
jgi:hypothetical protein